jgi:hypothetical protein
VQAQKACSPQIASLITSIQALSLLNSRDVQLPLLYFFNRCTSLFHLIVPPCPLDIKHNQARHRHRTHPHLTDKIIKVIQFRRPNPLWKPNHLERLICSSSMLICGPVRSITVYVILSKIYFGERYNFLFRDVKLHYSIGRRQYIGLIRFRMKPAFSDSPILFRSARGVLG